MKTFSRMLTAAFVFALAAFTFSTLKQVESTSSLPKVEMAAQTASLASSAETVKAVLYVQQTNSPLRRSVWAGAPARAVFKPDVVFVSDYSSEIWQGHFKPPDLRRKNKGVIKLPAATTKAYGLTGVENVRAREKV